MKKRSKKIIIGVFLYTCSFLLMSSNVFAKCIENIWSVNNSYTEKEKQTIYSKANSICTALTEDNFKCGLTSEENGDKVFYYCKKTDQQAESTTSTTNPTTSNQDKKSEDQDIQQTGRKIIFDENYGYGLECESPIGYAITGDGINSSSICYGYVPKSSINFPSSSARMTRENKNLLGWTSSLINGVPACVTTGYSDSRVSTILPYDTSVDITQDSGEETFYACYDDVINGVRYAQDDASADGQEVLCGSFLHITECFKKDGVDLCNYDKYGSAARNGVVYRYKISNEQSIGYCKLNSTAESCHEYDDEIPGYRYAQSNAYASGDVKVKCGDKLHITTCNCNGEAICMFDEINGQSVTGTVYRKYLNLKNDVTCSDEKKCTSNEKDVTSAIINVCKGKNYKDLVTCKKGFVIDETNSKQIGKCDGNNDCDKYQVVCKKKVGEKLTIDASSVNVDGNGKGILIVKASSTAGSIVQLYVSQNYVVPTESSDWIEFKNSAKIQGDPGTYYIWVKDSDGNISDAYRTAIIDNVNTKTTINSLKLYDDKGNVQTPNPVAYETSEITPSNYVRLSNKLVENSLIANAAFNPFTTEYKVTVDSPTMAVYATLTSTDSKYVEGYEPRTVNLTYGINTILIKIQDNTGKIRTYTIIVTRTDDRKSDNTLNELSVDKGKLEFNSNNTDYKVIIPKSTTNVTLKATIGSDLSSFIEGYEPGNIEIKNDVTVKLIKVKSQTGSTRTYVITFVKEGSDIVTDKSLMLHNLSISNVYVPFEKEILNYSFSASYENETINLYPILEDDTSKYIISLKKMSDSQYNVVSGYGIPLEVGENYLEIKIINSVGKEAIYRLTIIRKEFGLEISNDTSLKDLTVLGHDIKFNPNKKDYTVKIKTEKTLVITAVPNSNRAEVFIRGNEELTGFSTVRVKVVAENGKSETYSIDIKKDIFNKTIEIGAIIVGCVIIFVTCCILIINKKRRQHKEYVEE